jgi:hypothetical protein
MITAEEQRILTETDQGFPVQTGDGTVWVRSKVKHQGWRIAYGNLDENWAFYWHEGDSFDPEGHTKPFRVRPVREVGRASNGMAFVADTYWERVE